VAVVPLLDELSAAAKLMGAVNCVRHVDGKLIGENTDGKGFVQSLRTLADPAGKQIVVVGAGGAARAIAVEVALAGAAQITIVNRTPQRGQELAALVNEQIKVSATFVPLVGDYRVEDGTDVLINATSIGLGDGRARVPVAIDSLRPETLVADVVFNPPQSRLLRDAAAHGCKTLDGLGMLVNQAAIAFRLWTNIEPDAAVMREAVEEFLEV
jgi:shikimate dehydrogenase